MGTTAASILRGVAGRPAHFYICIHGAADKVRGAQRFDEMAKRKKPIATVNRKPGTARVQKPFLKDLDAYRKPLKLSRPAALVKLATEHLAGLKEPAEKLWEGAVERMFPVASGVKGDDPR
jgi:hypothetical protein